MAAISLLTGAPTALRLVHVGQGCNVTYDEAFEQSLLAAIFPKAAVAAGAFYRYLDLEAPLARVSLRLSIEAFCNTHVMCCLATSL